MWMTVGSLSVECSHARHGGLGTCEVLPDTAGAQFVDA